MNEKQVQAEEIDLAAQLAEAKQRLAEFAEQQQELEDFLAAGPVGIHRLSADGTILWANQAELDLLGYCQSDYLNHNIAEFYANRDTIAEILSKLKKLETIHNYEVGLRCRDGSIKTALISANAYCRNGELIHSRCFTRDITDRKNIELSSASRYLQAREAMRVKDESLKLLQSREALLMGQNRVLKYIAQGGSLNSALDMLAQVIEKELTQGSMVSILLLDKDGKHVRHGGGPSLPAEYKSSIDGEEIGPAAGSCGTAAFTRQPVIVADIETSVLWKDYRELARRFQLRSCWSTPIISSTGTVLGTFAIYYRKPASPTAADLTFIKHITHVTSIIIERKHEEAERARIQAELCEASKLKDEFIAIMSHELRTPLTAILGWTRLLRGGKLDAQSATKALETIERNVRSQSQLIEDLLDISRISSGKLRLDLTPVDLVEVVSSAVDAIRIAAEAKHIRIKTRLDCGITRVAGDQERLKQIVCNLLTNAVKFTPENGAIEVQLIELKNEIELKVCDNGKGISAEFLTSIFDRFAQLDNASTRTNGLGLGLAIVKELVELHGGTIVADSKGEDLGTTFTVKLPLLSTERDGEVKEVRNTGSHAVAVLSNDLAGFKILVIDDQHDTCELLQLVFEQYGAEIKTTNSTAGALEILSQWLPDVLVTDIGMPDEDGYALINKIRHLPPERGGKIPAIALTAFARDEDRIKALSAGFQMHVAKPVDPQELIKIIVGIKNLQLPA